MKYSISIISLLCLLASCTCSSPPECVADSTIIQFKNYQKIDVDSILIQIFTANTGFSNLSTEYISSAIEDSTNASPYISLGLKTRYDYRFTVLSDSNSFDISELGFQEREKKKRGLCLRYTKEYTTIECPFSSILVNGQNALLQSDGMIKLEK